jgi:hypothetical protein
MYTPSTPAAGSEIAVYESLSSAATYNSRLGIFSISIPVG